MPSHADRNPPISPSSKPPPSPSPVGLVRHPVIVSPRFRTLTISLCASLPVSPSSTSWASKCPPPDIPWHVLVWGGTSSVGAYAKSLGTTHTIEQIRTATGGALYHTID